MIKIKKLLAPSEVKVCFSFLDEIEKEVNSMMFSKIKEIVSVQLMDFERVRHAVFQDKMVPKQIVLIALSNVAGECLGSGHFHVYRGALNMQGQEIRKVWDYATKEMLKEGYHSQKEYDEDQKWIQEEIKKVG